MKLPSTNRMIAISDVIVRAGVFAKKGEEFQASGEEVFVMLSGEKAVLHTDEEAARIQKEIEVEKAKAAKETPTKK